MEAGKLKNLTVNGVSTKVVALGIGDQVDVRELNGMASEPAYRNVIRVQDFSKLRDVEEELRNTSCPSSNSSMSWICNCEKITVEFMLLLKQLHLIMKIIFKNEHTWTEAAMIRYKKCIF